MKKTNVSDFKEFIGRASSRKFLLTLGTFLIIILNKRFALGLDDADIYTLSGIVAIYIGVQGGLDGMKK